MATQTRLPTGDSTAQWTALNGGTHTAEVNDGSDSTYISAATDDLVARFTYTDFALPASATITNVLVTVRARMTAGSGNIRPFIVADGATDFGGAVIPITTSLANYTKTWSVNPADGLTWTQADVEETGGHPLNGLFGCYSHGISGGTMQVAAIEITATYTTGSSGGGGGITTRTIYTLPTLPTIGAAGSTFTDPTFGSRMARVTDGAFTTDLGTTNGSFTTASAGYQQEWNADGTKFFIVAHDGNHYLC
ncbi:MAG TPA: hypothetical protein VMZ90_03490, partial [Vicinamibacterales bacterium]|nr:hypothetical protein [Vicinamibacterales bacterium]